MLNLKGDDCAMAMRYGREQMFVVDATVKDALGTSLTGETVSVKIDDAVLQKMTHGGATVTNPNVPNLSLSSFDVYTVKEDADFGMHTIMLSSGTGADQVTQNLTYYVAGPPETFRIAGPTTIAPGDDAMFTVTATDENGGIPHLTDETKMVAASVSFAPADAASATGIDSDGMIMLDDMGMATITVDGFAANPGDRGRIHVGSGMMRVEHTFTFGTAVTPGDMLGTPMGVTTGFNRGGALQVSWTKAANAAGYIIIAININDVNNDVVTDVTNDGDDENWNIRGLTPGATYDVYVAATASGGRNTLSDPVRVMAQ